MSEKKISYTNRTFEDYKKSLKEYINRYYPEISNDFNDASVGSWLIDLIAAVSDNLSFHIDRVYNETNVDSAQQKSSLYSMARSNGFKVPGPKGAITEVKFKCVLPVYVKDGNNSSNGGVPNMNFAPVIKKGTKLASSSQIFEVMNDIDFSEQFDENGVSNREIIPQMNSNGSIVSYAVTKTATVVAGESKVYKQVIKNDDLKPFMEVILPDTNVMNVESIIFRRGGNFNTTPSNNEFFINREYINAKENSNCNGMGVDFYRFFEVDSLLDQYRWTYDEENTSEEGKQFTNQPVKYTYGYYDAKNSIEVPTACITKGRWMPLTQKFITEFTDKGYLKVIFGAGETAGHLVDYTCATDFSQAQISRMIKNDSMGKLPPQGDGGEWTMFIKYRVGGGASSNIAAGSLNNIVLLDATVGRNINTNDDKKIANAVKNSITVTNTIPSISGKDAPTVDELKNMIKYHNASQNRCVTVKDYENRILLMPPMYGSPFRISVTEENNKVMVYLIGIDHMGYLTPTLPEQLVKNIINYLSMYKSINDYVEIKSGRIINLSFEVDLFVDKNYNHGDVVKSVINTIKDYMDTNKRRLGEDIYVGDIQKEISKVDGVLNLIDLRVYNEYGSGYSSVRTTQETTTMRTKCVGEELILSNDEMDRQQIDLMASDYVLLTDSDSIFEVKYPNTDIKVRIKSR